MKEVIKSPFLDFIESDSGKKIKEIFIYLFDKLDEWDVLVLLTRKGYWLFRMICWYLGLRIPPSKKYFIMSDRKVDKGDIREVKDQLKKLDAVIYIVDDTLSTGLTAYRIYRIFNEEWPQAHVIPLTCFIAVAEDGSKKTLIDRSIQKQGCDEIDKRFLKDLSYFHLAPSAELGKLSYKQALVAQLEMVPYVVDLPFLVDHSFDGNERVSPFFKIETHCSNRRFSVVERSKLERLMVGNADWTYHDNSYYICKSYEKRLISNGIFVYSGEELSTLLKESALNMVIKFRYEYMEDDKAALMFTPFVMLKSADFEDIWNAFRIIFEYAPGGDMSRRSDYYEYILERYREKGPENVGLNIFRTVIYFFSYYLGKVFSQWVKQDFQIELKFDESFSHENSGREFNSFIHDLGDVKPADYYELLSRIPSWKANEDAVIDEMEADSLCSYDDSMSWDETIYNIVYLNIIQRKRRGKSSELFTVEDMEATLERYVPYKSREELQLVLTKTLLRMLDISVIGNRVWFKDGKIYRGFRYGENSDIIVPFFNQYLHYGVDLFYRKLAWDDAQDKNLKFHRHILDLIDSIACMLREKGYMGYAVTESEVRYNKMYYGGCTDEIQGLILNKSFLLETINTDEVIYREITHVVDEFEF